MNSGTYSDIQLGGYIGYHIPMAERTADPMIS